MEKMLEFHQPIGGNKLWHDMPTTEQFRSFSKIVPYSQESIFYNQTKSIQPLTQNSVSSSTFPRSSIVTNIQASTKIANSYIGGATNRNEIISRTLDAYELGYRSLPNSKNWAYTGPNSSFTLPSWNQIHQQMSFRQPYQFKPPKLPSSFSSYRGW